MVTLIDAIDSQSLMGSRLGCDRFQAVTLY